MSDEAVGIKAHDKLDASLKPKLIEEAVFMPYSRSGEKATEAVSLTSQTVMNSIRELGGVYNNSDELWLEVADYIDQVYDVASIEKIYLSGDGAPWIKNGLNWIKGSIYVLDRYHLSKYVTQATAHMGYTTPIMW